MRHDTPAEIPACKAKKKHECVLEAAQTVFLKNGYGRASVDLIAKEAGVSKATLYAHFASKEALFAAMIGSECAKMQMPVLEDHRFPDAQTALYTFGKQFLDFLLCPQATAVYRIILAESVHFSELGGLFYNAGPANIKTGFIQFLRQMEQRGWLCVGDDATIAAEQFIGMIHGPIHMKHILDLPDKPPAERIDILIHAAVDTFLCRYGIGQR